MNSEVVNVNVRFRCSCGCLPPVSIDFGRFGGAAEAMSVDGVSGRYSTQDSCCSNGSATGVDSGEG